MRRVLFVSILAFAWLAACGPAGGGTTPPPDGSDLRTEQLLLPGSLTPTLVTYRVVGDLAVIGGDIVIGRIEPGSGTFVPHGAAAQGVRPQGAGITAWSQLWAGGVVPYAIDTGIPEDQEQDVLAAIAHWEASTPIDFLESAPGSAPSLLFTTREGDHDAGACLATIGAAPESRVWLGEACGLREIVHGIGHVVGLYHEHQRHDAHDHVDVIEANVREGFLHAFDRLPADLSLAEYDLDSVMHASAQAFLRPDAPVGAVSLRVLTPGQDIGTRTELSAGDIAAVGAMYGGGRAFFSAAAVLGSGIDRTFTWTLENTAGHDPACEILVGYAAGWRTVASPDCTAGSHAVTFDETGPIPAALGVRSNGRVHDRAFFLLDIAAGTSVQVSVSPAAVQLAPGETTTFTATVTGAVDPSVTWSVSGGAIDTGDDPVTYTAPALEGVFTVTAASVEDPTATDTATVTVVSASSGPRYSAEELAYFEEVAVGSEYGPEGWIARWEQDILLQIEGSPTPEDLATLESVIDELEILIHPRRIQIVDVSPTMRMHFVPVSEFADIEPDYVPGSSGFFTFDFVGLLGPEDEKLLATIHESTVLVSSTGITQLQRSHLIREQLTQALGLGNDSLVYPESIFYDGQSTVTEFLEIDRAVIEMLYRPELGSDMSTAEVLDTLAALRGDPATQSRGDRPDAPSERGSEAVLVTAGGG